MSSEGPDHWQSSTLGDVVQSMTAGVSVNADNRPIEGDEIGVLRTSCVSGGHFDASEHKAILPGEVDRVRTPVKSGSIIISRMNTPALVGANAYVDQDHPDLFLPDRLWQLRTNARADCRWLSYFMQTAAFRLFIDDIATGTSGSMKNISKERLLRMPLALPPLDEQRRIAEVLLSVDDAIAAAEEAVEIVKNLLIRVRDEMISQPIWGKIALSDATSAGLFTDGDWVESKDQDPNGEVRLIQLADIGDGCFVDKSRRHLTMEKAKQLRCTFLEEGDLLIARMPEPLGRCCLFPSITQPSVTVVDVCVVRASNITSNRYLHHAIATSEFRSQVLACASGTTRTRVSRGNLGQLELAMPPLAEQEAIADELDQISIVAGEQRQAAERLKDLKHGLMSDLLSGRVRVPA